jgi:hypothetical protein
MSVSITTSISNAGSYAAIGEEEFHVRHERKGRYNTMRRAMYESRNYGTKAVVRKERKYFVVYVLRSR